MPVRMTETAISKAMREVANGTRRDLADAGCPGLRLRLTPGGAASWVLACRDRHGRMRRFPLGGYPAMGISDARSKARELHTRVRQDGADPIADRRRDRAIGAAAKVGEGTLSALLSLYGRQRGAELKRWAEAKRSVEVVFKPLLGRAAGRPEIAGFPDAGRWIPCPTCRRCRDSLRAPGSEMGSNARVHRLRSRRSPSSCPGQAAQANPDPRRTRSGVASSAGVRAVPTPPRCGSCC